MTETPETLGRLAFERAEHLVRYAARKYPMLDSAQLVILMASAMGLAMAEESFPERPAWDGMLIAKVAGATAGVALQHLTKNEILDCRGKA